MLPQSTLLVIVAVAALMGVCDAGVVAAKPDEGVKVVEKTGSGLKNGTRRGRAANFDEFLGCAAIGDYGCVIVTSEGYLVDTTRSLLVEADAAALQQTGRSDQDNSPSLLVKTIGKLISEFTSAFEGSIGGFFRTGKEEDEDDEDSLEEQGRAKGSNALKSRENGEPRGKKKKLKEKIIYFIKAVVIALLIKAKLSLLLKVLALHLQFKFLAIALANLLLNKAKFFIDLKKGHHPEKVIYYEHAQHQHHYEGGDEWGEPSGGYWKRSEDEGDMGSQEQAYYGQRPNYYSVVTSKPDSMWWW